MSRWVIYYVSDSIGLIENKATRIAYFYMMVRLLPNGAFFD